MQHPLKAAPSSEAAKRQRTTPRAAAVAFCTVLLAIVGAGFAAQLTKSNGSSGAPPANAGGCGGMSGVCIAPECMHALGGGKLSG